MQFMLVCKKSYYVQLIWIFLIINLHARYLTFGDTLNVQMLDHFVLCIKLQTIFVLKLLHLARYNANI